MHTDIYPRGRSPASRFGRLAIVGTLVVAALLATSPSVAAISVYGSGARHYVAAGDDIPNGNKVSSDENFPHQLYDDHLSKYGWMVINIAANGTTSSSYITGAQLSQTWNYRPDLVTLTVGEQNDTIKDLIDSCFDKVKKHDFTGATTCASSVLGNTTLFTNLTNNLTTTLQQYRLIMAGRPQLVVAVTGYPNPYPKSSDATTNVPIFCTALVDVIPTCLTRWLQFPIALTVIDKAFQKLNTTIKDALKPFQAGPSGNRFVYVDTYTKTRDHCMKMDVTINITVNHGQYTDTHRSQKDFGCSSPWYVEGSAGTDEPSYLDPAAFGVLVSKTQTTQGMGVYPNKDGHKCIADLIWEADTIDPGTTPLKWKLGVGEAADSNICQ